MARVLSIWLFRILVVLLLLEVGLRIEWYARERQARSGPKRERCTCSR
jgi:hypothetical protein